MTHLASGQADSSQMPAEIAERPYTNESSASELGVTEDHYQGEAGAAKFMRSVLDPRRRWILYLIGIAVLFFLLWLVTRSSDRPADSFVGIRPLYPPGNSRSSKSRSRRTGVRHSGRSSRYSSASLTDRTEDLETKSGTFAREDLGGDLDSERSGETPSQGRSIRTVSSTQSTRPSAPKYFFTDISAALAQKRKNESNGEAICRAAFQAIYQLPFSSVRPNFLKNPETGRNLELDGYNEELGIAFEYNGKQHYVFPNCWHTTRDVFDAQIRRDIFKHEVCRRAGITLIPIPYTIPHVQLYDYILERAPAVQNN